MAAHGLLLFLPMMLTKIYIELSGTFNEIDPNLKIYLTGKDISPISEQEAINFNLTEESLKNAVTEYFGMAPSEVFMNSPRHLRNSQQTWEPISRHLEPQNGKLLKITPKNITILNQTFENHARKPVLYNVAVQKTVENIVRSTWENDSLTVIDDVAYDIDIDSAGTKTAFGYTSKWGHDSEQGQLISLGMPSLNISVDPYQVITTKLQATKVEITFEVHYTAFLSGYLVSNYATGHGEHNYWALNIEAVMEKGNLKNELRAKELVEFTFYINPKIIVHDKETGEKLMEVVC